MSRLPARGLYAITDAALLPDTRLADAVAEAIAGGAVLIQFRDKGDDGERRTRLAGAVLEVCRGAGVPLLINDDVALALRVGADGVHLGRDDAALAPARERLGAEAIIGISCYNDLERARRASREGADYVAFGRFFPSRTKPRAVPAAPALLRSARTELDRPLVAIGGITPENGRPLIEAGADLLAAIHGVFGAGDVRAAAAAYAALFAPR